MLLLCLSSHTVLIADPVQQSKGHYFSVPNWFQVGINIVHATAAINTLLVKAKLLTTIAPEVKTYAKVIYVHVLFLILLFQLGSIFTLCVAGERLTFLTDPDDFGYFFNSSDVDFQHGVQDAVMKVG